MKLTENAKLLRDQLTERLKLTNEIARVEKIGSDAAAEEASMLVNGDALESTGKITLLQRLRTKSTLAPNRVAQLQVELASLDQRLGTLADICCNETFEATGTVEASRYQKFCAAVAPYFEGGLENKFFHANPHAPGRAKSRNWFAETDSASALVRLRKTLPHPQHSKDAPHVKAATLLRLLPTIPVE